MIYILIIIALILFFQNQVSNQDTMVNTIYQKYNSILTSCATRFNIPVKYIVGIIMQESSGNENVSDGAAGDRGLMQITPDALADVNSRYGTAITYDQLTDPTNNIFVGSAYLSLKISEFAGNYQQAIQAYNAGAGTVEANPAASLSYFQAVNKFASFLSLT